MSDYSYIRESDVSAVRSVHQSYQEYGHCDGFYNMPKGEFDVSSAATRLQIALEVREAFRANCAGSYEEMHARRMGAC